MDEATYRILDILSQRLGIPMSINEITKNIGEIHGGAYYANTHKKIKELDREEVLTLTRAGRSSLVSLNFDNYMIIGMLAEMELRRKHDFLKGKQEMHSIRTKNSDKFSKKLLLAVEKIVRIFNQITMHRQCGIIFERMRS